MRIVLVVPSRRDPAHRRVLGALRREFSACGDAVYPFPPKDGLSSAGLRRGLERLLQERRADVCHIQFFSRGLGYLGRVRFPSRLRVVLTHQGASCELMERPDVFRSIARRASVLTAVSRHGLRELKGFLPGTPRKSRCIPNGTDLVSASARRDNPARKPFILSVCRLAAYKGSDLLLLAFAELAQREPGLRLVICGRDQTGGRLARFAGRLGLRGRVRLLGEVNPSRVSRLLEDCLFFVLPSRRENMPMALLEAMAAGKAVAACAVGGVPEMVEDGVDGLLVAPGDASALAAAMSLLARDARLRRRLGKQAAMRARFFGWKLVAARYRRLYASVSRSA